MLTRDQRWNIACHWLDGVFFFAALITISSEVVIPTMVTDLSDRAFHVGLITLVLQFGVMLPQVFYAKRVEGLAYKKPAVVLTAVLQRMWWVPFLVSLFVWWDARITLPILFFVLAANSIGSGLIVPVWTDWYAKTVPEHLWGRVLGMRRVIASFLGIGLGALIGKVMDSFPAPERYRILVAVGLVFYALSLLFVALVREERAEGLPSNRGMSLFDYFRGLGAILTRRRDFMRFMLACVFVSLPVVIFMSYLTKYGRSHGAYTDVATGAWTVCYFGVLGAGAFVGGILSDRCGVISPFRLLPVTVMAAGVVAAISAHPVAISIAWALTGFSLGVQMVVMMPAVFKFSGPLRRPTFMALRFVLLGTVAALVPPLAGGAIDAGWLSYRSLFMACAALAGAAWLMFLRMPAPQAEPAPVTACQPSEPPAGR